MSERAQKILTWLRSFPLPQGEGLVRTIRQQTLAEEFGCSRRTIGRALKELKEAGLLVDLNKRHENRCKLYQVKIPPCAEASEGKPLTPKAQRQWELYEKTFRIVFKVPDLEKQYAGVAWELRHVTEEMELWRKTWAGLRVVYGHEPLLFN